MQKYIFIYIVAEQYFLIDIKLLNLLKETLQKWINTLWSVHWYLSQAVRIRAAEGHRCRVHWLIRLISSKCFIHLNTHKNYTLQK